MNKTQGEPVTQSGRVSSRCGESSGFKSQQVHTHDEIIKKAYDKLEQKEFRFTLRDRETDKVSGTRHAIKVADAKKILKQALSTQQDDFIKQNNNAFTLGYQEARDDFIKMIDDILKDEYAYDIPEQTIHASELSKLTAKLKLRLKDEN